MAALIPRRQTVYLNGKYAGHATTGTERFAHEVTRRLLAAQDRPTVLLLPRGVEPPEGVDPSRCRHLPLRGNAFEQIALPLATLGALLLNLGGPAPLLKRRQLVTMHDATPFRAPSTFSRVFVLWYRLLYTVLARTAEHLVTVSRFSAGELADVLGVPASRFVVTGCGTEHLPAPGAGARPANLPAGVTSFVLLLGTLARHKNVVPVAHSLSRAGIDVVVVGSLGRPEVFGGTSSGWSNSAGRVHVLGRLPDDAIGWLYRNAEVFVMPSWYEGFGIPVVEAQASGCPVIASYAASLPEVGGDGAAYFDPGSPEQVVALASRITGLDGERRRELVERGRRNAERFSWEAVARTIAALSATGVSGSPVAGAADLARSPAGTVHRTDDRGVDDH